VPEPILEVIALNVSDARAARAGGADRIELVTDMRRQGLTPDLATFAAVREVVDLPVRVMLRAEDGYLPSDPDTLAEAATALRRAGADEFVLGFLDAGGAVDLAAVGTVLDAIDGCRWTFHRALDHAADRTAARRALQGLPGLDFLLTAGGPATVAEGLATLSAEAAAPARPPGPGDAAPPRVLAGGGLRPAHLPALLAAGIDAFHTGSAVRKDGRWDAPIDAALVRRWRAALR
jgi:copper homeostasis protein